MQILLYALFLAVAASSSDALRANELKGEANIESVDVALKSAVSTITCADYSKLKASIAKDLAAYKTDRAFSEPATNDPKSPSFIIFDKKTWTISVCDKSKMVSAVLDSKRTEDSQIEIENSYLFDMNNDGKTEFVLGDLQCVEGPCIGNFYLFQIDGSQIRKLNVIHTTAHSLTEIRNEHVLELKKLCFTHEFGVAFEWFTVGTFTKDKKLTELPYGDIEKQYPALLKDFDTSVKGQFERAKDFPSDKKNEIYAGISRLLLRAYNGEPAKTLLTELDVLIKPSEKTGGLPIYCDPKALISMIAK